MNGRLWRGVEGSLIIAVFTACVSLIGPSKAQKHQESVQVPISVIGSLLSVLKHEMLCERELAGRVRLWNPAHSTDLPTLEGYEASWWPLSPRLYKPHIQ